jgi:hypothetical protein
MGKILTFVTNQNLPSLYVPEFDFVKLQYKSASIYKDSILNDKN